MRKILCLLVLFLINPFAFAGMNCTQNPNLPAATQRAAILEKTLDQFNPQVALIARVGSDLSQYHLYYTHLAFVVQDYPKRKQRWTVIQLINPCGTDYSEIKIQSLLDFFTDDLYNMDFQITLLTPEVQERLLKTLLSSLKYTLHNPHYSMIAYPFATRYQNSNQWVLEILSGAKTREDAQKVLQINHFTPSTITVGFWQKWGAQLFRPNVAFDDHPAEEQKTRQYSVVSVDSVIQYLKRNDMMARNHEYRSAY